MSAREKQLLERLREATRALRRTLDERDALLRARDEPIAIVGIGCRFPGGVEDPASYWDLLLEGRDAVVALDERWAQVGAAPKESAPRWAGLLTGRVDEFDASFFGVTPREAVSLDPQQRLLLELGWEALEDAGVPPHTLRGSQTGVFIGATNTDYADLLARLPPAERDMYTVTGNLISVAAGRLSYTWGLQGPCMTVDTVCSSSLVVVHLACASLRAGECDLALAGGVNLLLSPETMDGLTRTQALSPGGRCKTFDALADGFARGEGGGLVALKRLSDARRDGDRIWALVRGSAVNQDGRAAGLTAPNQRAQEDLLRAALERAGVRPEQIGFVETHGTGTALGDPIEVEALRSVLGAPRPDGARCLLGAVKTNLGHLEAAAGVAGLIKAALVLRHGRIPKNLHLRRPNPRLPLEGSSLALASEPVTWPQGPAPRLAGVSSFGLSGTNAHVILEQAPEPEPAPSESAPAPARPATLITLSAKTQAALAEQVRRLREHLERHPDDGVGDLGYSLATTRSPMAQRLAITATTREALLATLAAVDRGEQPGNVSTGTARDVGAKLAFLFTGQGAQRVGMGQRLHATWPAFRAAFDRCAARFDAALPSPLRDIMWAAPKSPEAARLDHTEFAQPALFTLEYALFELWRSWGVEPALLAGHSVGELVAACVAGVFSLDDAARLVTARGRLMQALPPGGAMASIAAPVAAVEAALVGRPGVAIAAINSPAQVVISGDADGVQSVAARFVADGHQTRALPVSHAFHSPRIEPMLEAFAAALQDIQFRAPRLPLISNLTGALAGPEVATPGYWLRHAREPVRFAAGVRALRDAGATCFLELGPRPALLSSVARCLPDETPPLLATLRSRRDEAESVCEALAGAWVCGAAPRWSGVFPEGGRRVPLPRYPWQRRRYWPWPASPSPAQRRPADAPAAGGEVGALYDALAHTNALAGGHEGDALAERYLTFAPFHERVPGFSWILATATPDAPAAHVERVLQAQREMRAVLFDALDLAACRTALDFGCGYATDLITLARQHPHLELHGCTISAEQARRGAQRARDAQLESRVRVLHRDSARDEFETTYDAVFGVEVACHIRDKRALLANVGAHLKPGGALVMADFVAQTSFDIDHEEAGSYLATQARWAEALAAAGLQLSECVDVSPQISNFLHDPDFATNLARVERERGDPTVRAAFKSYDQLGKLLERGLARYTLMTARRVADVEADADVDALARDNAAALAAMTPYPAALRRLATRGRDDERFFAVHWEPAPAPAPAPTPGVRDGRWILLGDGGLAGPLADALGSAGHRVARVALERDPVALGARLQAAFAGEAPTAIVHLGALEGRGEPLTAEGLEAAVARGCDVALAAVQAVGAAGWRDAPRLWLITRGAQAAAERDVDPLQAPLVGLGRVAALEHPELRCARVDLDPARPDDAIKRLSSELLADDVEDELAWRDGTRLVARLVRRAPEAVASGEGARPRPDGSYLITGGLGGLGLGVARWMAEQGAGHLVLLGRGGVTTEAQRAAVVALEGTGARVTIARADVADREQLAGVLRDLEIAGPPLRGVVHTAGIAAPAMLRSLTPDRVRAVMAAKALGACHLHALTRVASLDFFVLYASVAGVLGLAGTGNYAAANAFLDALAHHRRVHGLRGLSIDWGLFSDVGLAQRVEAGERSVQGLRGMPAEAGLGALARVLGRDGQLAYAELDARQWVDAYPAAAASPRWSRLLARAATVREGAPGLLERLVALSPAERRARASALAREHVSQVLRIPPEELPDDAPLTSLGMDSLMGLELRNRIERALGVSVPSTLLWTYPTINALRDFVLGLASEGEAAPEEVAPDEVAPDEGGDRDDDEPLTLDASLELIDAEFDALLES